MTHDKQSGAELKECPFCGGEANVTSTRAGGLEWWAVECAVDDCRATGPERGGEAEAITAWNTRSLPQAGEPAPEYYRDEPALEMPESVIRRREWRERNAAQAGESVVEAVARAMLADELSWSAPKRDFDTEWEHEREAWLKNARAAINALRGETVSEDTVQSVAAAIERAFYEAVDSGTNNEKFKPIARAAIAALTDQEASA